MIKKSTRLSKSDLLAIDRTKMANERTFLAYFRTFIVILSSGIAILKLTILADILDLGIILVIIAPIILFIGVARFVHIRKHIYTYYGEDLEREVLRAQQDTKED